MQVFTLPHLIQVQLPMLNPSSVADHLLQPPFPKSACISSGSCRSSFPNCAPLTHCFIPAPTPAGRLSTDLHLSFLTFKSNPLVPSPTLQQTTGWDLSFLSVLISREPIKQILVEHPAFFPLLEHLSSYPSHSPFLSLRSQNPETLLTWNPQCLYLSRSQKIFLQATHSYHSPKIQRRHKPRNKTLNKDNTSHQYLEL